MAQADYSVETALRAEGFAVIAGADEAGMGCLAGPVVAAVVVLDRGNDVSFLNDSKKVAPRKRKRLALEIKEKATAWAVGMASPAEIDALNIRQADFLAIRRALQALAIKPDALIADGFCAPGLPLHCHPLVKGDSISRSVAAASIIAKTERDALMELMENEHPGYGFAAHKGYGTAEHMAALEKQGPCPLHRRSFYPVSAIKERRASETARLRAE